MNDASEEDLLARHRKEKKDLQGQITKLKHSVPKGDKKKKKEITTEVAKLEAELNQKHEEELRQFHQDKSNVQVNEVTEQVNSLSTEERPVGDSETKELSKKPSKAARRREKKAQQSRERDERIKESEQDNLLGNRHIEAEKLKSILLKRGLSIHEVHSDGNCLYTAVLDQLTRLGIKSSMERLRQQTADHMRNNMDDFLPFLTQPDSGDPYTPEEYEKYCDDVAETAAWGGQLEIRALSNVLRKSIEVVQADGPCVLTGEEYAGQALILSYHRHVYELGEHYNSVIPKVEEEEDEFT